ncbi:MAG TPA: DUF6082 family protein [Actinospica sp.]|nr:DUF6082 family protein [Actinospica sp.]
MSSTEEHDAPDLLRRMLSARNGALIFLAFALATTVVSVGITAVLASVFGQNLGDRMGTLGQIFESVNAAFSGLAFIALVVTFRLQYDELKLQRAELQNQHLAMDKSQGELHRSAEADIRTLHMRLIQMSMDDEDLAAVWPQYQGPVSPVRARQHNYSNLIIQHQRMLYELGYLDREDVLGVLRYLFTSALMRSFWEGQMVARQVIRLDARDAAFYEIADTAFRDSAPPEPPTPPRGKRGADVIDLEVRRNSGSDAA